jgi:hypothetical protein
MAIAKDVASVIAGEAVSGTPEERKADMLAIASAIVNRARQAGVSVDDIVAGDDQFAAYGKALPPGVDSELVNMAQEALDEVQTYGPVHNSTYYATPNAVGNLPSGLTLETSTTGHQYFSDPLSRPIKTAAGVKSMSGELGSRLMTPTGLLGNPTATADTGILSALNASYDPSQTTGQQAIKSILSQPAQTTQTADTTTSGEFTPMNMASINPDPTGSHRPYAPNTEVTDKIQSAVTSILGPGASVQVTSGQEGGLAQFGSNRHQTGLAADVNIMAPDGHVLSLSNPADEQAMKDIAQSAATQQANIGLGYKNSPTMMHVDYVPSSSLTAGQDQSWGRVGNDPEFAGLLSEARSSALMPASFYEKANQNVIDKGIVPSSPQGLIAAQQEQQPGVTSSLLSTPNQPVTLTDLPAASPTPEYAATTSMPDYSSMIDQRSVPTQPTAAMPSYADMTQAQPMSLPSAMAMETPNFNQAMSAATTGIPASTPTMPSIQGPSSLPAIQQQQQQAQPQQLMTNTPQAQAMRTAQTQSKPKGLLDGVFTKEALAGGLLGSVAAGPVGGLLGGLLGRQIANNGGLQAMMHGQPLSINNIGTGLPNIASIYSGSQAPGTQATANNGGLVTSLSNGGTAYTNPMGVTSITDAYGNQMADWSGNNYGIL